MNNKAEKGKPMITGVIWFVLSFLALAAPGQTILVNAYGAKGDGVTDDTTGILDNIVIENEGGKDRGAIFVDRPGIIQLRGIANALKVDTGLDRF